MLKKVHFKIILNYPIHNPDPENIFFSNFHQWETAFIK